jgi:Stage II sporulation protein E (SpoIIE)
MDGLSPPYVTTAPRGAGGIGSDGITEAHQRGQRQFGCRRLAALLADHRKLAPPELVRCITRAVTESCNGKLSDDATVVCLDWHPPQPLRQTG